MDELHATCLALRDLIETTGATKAVLHFDGLTVSASPSGVFLAADGTVEDISEWVDDVRLVAA